MEFVRHVYCLKYLNESLIENISEIVCYHINKISHNLYNNQATHESIDLKHNITCDMINTNTPFRVKNVVQLCHFPF